MKHFLFSIIAFCSSVLSFSQGLAVYTDYLNNVQLFDSGHFREIEHLPLVSYKIGNKAFAYEDNTRNFKVYYNHFIFNVSDFVSDYTVTDNLIAFNLNSQLKVFDNGSSKTLSVHVDKYKAGDEAFKYKAGDEVIAFYDNQDRMFKVYFNHEIYELDDLLTSTSEPDFDVGENTVVFKNAQGYFQIFYNGEMYDLLFGERTKKYKAGRDMVAFVETPVNNFQVFYKGEFMEIENFEPKSFKMGDGFVAYIDSNNYLKLFNGKETITVSFDAPTMYDVEDELLVFTVQNDFKVFWKGKSYTLENHIPKSFKMDCNILAYIDEHGYLKVFDKGIQKTLSYEAVEKYKCHGNTVYYSYGVKSNDIYYQGKTYSGE